MQGGEESELWDKVGLGRKEVPLYERWDTVGFWFLTMWGQS